MIDRLLIALTRLLTGAVAYRHDFDFAPYAQRIYYANHSSHMDTLLIWSLVPPSQRPHVHPAAAKDYWWTSRWKRYLAEQVLRAVPVVRQRENATDDPLEEVDATLARGESLIIFPEGTRGTGEKIQPFKSGLYRLAAKHPAAVLVPVYIDNLNRVMPKGEWLPVPMLCTVHFGAGFTLEREETKADFLARAQSRLEALAAP